MPWKVVDGKTYFIPKYENEKDKFTDKDFFMAITFQKMAEKVCVGNKLDNFLMKEVLKPITVNDTEKDNILNTKEEVQRYILSYKGKPFHEAIRGGAPLSSFAYANGMNHRDLLLMEEHPDDPRVPAIRERFEAIRKEFIEMVCSKDSALAESKAADYYFKFITRAEADLEKYNGRDDLSYEDYAEISFLTSGFQNVGVQTFMRGNLNDPSSFPGTRIVNMVNERLKAANKKYDFTTFFNLASMTTIGQQSAENVYSNTLEGNTEFEKDSVTAYTDFIEAPVRFFKGVTVFKEFFKTSGKTLNEKLPSLTKEKAGEKLVHIVMPDENPKTDDLFDACVLEGYSEIDTFMNIGKDQIKSILERERKTIFGAKENSAEYTDVQNKFKEILVENTVNEGVSVDSYKDLYDKCKTYIERKDGNPNTQVGKDRLNAVSKLFFNIGEKLKEVTPDMKDEIESNNRRFFEKSEQFKRALNSDSINMANEIEKNEISNIKEKINLGGSRDNLESVIDSVSKLVYINSVKIHGKSEDVRNLMSEEVMEEKLYDIKPLCAYMIKHSSRDAINKIVNGKDIAKGFNDLLGKSIKNERERQIAKSEFDTEMTQKEVNKITI